MVGSPDIDFARIAERCGGKREAFEELCCQIAALQRRPDPTFRRIRGAGGDGGVECSANLPDGSRIGWQAKYVFDVDSLLTQATKSLKTALKIHSSLSKFVLCYPFDLTGPTGRGGRDGTQKVEEWKREQIQQAAAEGRTLAIEEWPGARLLELLVVLDVSGGVRAYFFDGPFLSPDWFEAHIAAAKVEAGPRYSDELNVGTDVRQWMSAFGRDDEWIARLCELTKKVTKEEESFDEAIHRTTRD